MEMLTVRSYRDLKAMASDPTKNQPPAQHQQVASSPDGEDDPILNDPEVPRDAKVMSMILKSMGVDQYEPRVVNQILEFMYRYLFEVLQDSQLYMEHAGRSDIALADVRLAIQSRVNYSFTQPPPREFKLLLELAQAKNSVPLPPLPQKFGVQIPPEEYCLIAPNYQVEPKQLRKEIAKQATASSNEPTTTTTTTTDSHAPPTKKADKQIPIKLSPQ